MPRRTTIPPANKAKAVLRLLAGESRDAVAAGLGVSSARIARWEQVFIDGGEIALEKDSQRRHHGFLSRHRAQILQWVVLVLVLLIATLLLTRFLTTGEV